MGRTTAACGFRWNSVVRKQYKEEIEKAKQEKRATRLKREDRGKLKLTAKQSSQSNYETVLKELTTSHQKIRRLEDENTSLKAQLNDKDQKIQDLENQIRANRTPEQVVNDDFHTFMSIMKRARDMGVLSDERLSESS